MFSYAANQTTNLSDAESSAVGAWIAKNIKPETVFPLAYRSWPGSWANGPVLNITPEVMRPVQINSLFWPRTASRFSSAFFVVSFQQLAAIRTAVFTNGKQESAKLTFGDGETEISAEMWTLPAIPLQEVLPGSGPQTTPAGQFYLLPLVDDRYWWWGESVNLIVNPGETTWEILYGDIGSVLGLQISVDPIADAYLAPSIDYKTGSRPLPSILDAIAWSVGQVIVRDLEGNVYAQNSSTASTIVDANFAAAPIPFAGGAFAFE